MHIAIIEDNASARELLAGMLRRHFPELRIAGTASTLEDGLTLIQATRPELLLLDIQLRDGQVFELLRQLDRHYLDRTGLIFITAYSTMENMYHALRASAIDYLTKPVDEAHFRSAVREAIGKAGRMPLTERLNTMEQALTGDPGQSRLPIHLPKGVIELIPLERILYLEGDENITYFHLLNGEKRSAMRNLGYYEQALPAGSDFYRISKPLIIHLRHLVRFDARTLRVCLTGDLWLPASRRRGRAFGEFLRSRER